jgi:hypothetical protein
MINISVDDARAQALMLVWMEKTGKTIEQGVTTAARATCKSFMQYTLPRENKKSERKVSGDIHRVYATQSMVFEDIKSKSPQAADAFWYFMEAKKFATARKIMQVESPKYGALSLYPFDGGELHKRLRDSRGHVSRAVTPKMVVRERGLKSKLATYIETKVNNVGLAKAGWVAAWRQLGRVTDVPDWVSRKRKIGNKNLGSAEKQTTKTGFAITIHNKVPYALPALGESID